MRCCAIRAWLETLLTSVSQPKSRPLKPMNANTVDFLAPKAMLAVIALAASLVSPLSQAQQVYRIVGPDGKVTFSDQPPAASSNAKVSEAISSGSGGASVAGLPFELKQVAQKYPVTLYSGSNCAPCGSARSMLSNRGIPFSEKTITTTQDNQALQRLSGDNTLPFLTIGSQQLKGFSDAEWTQFLNAAGYPTTSKLPPSYRPPAPTPLVAMTTAPAAVGTTAKTPVANQQRPVPVQPPAASNNPSGIRF